MSFLLDTNICIFHLRGIISLKEMFLQKGIRKCYISDVTILELIYGAENSKNPEKSMAILNEMLIDLITIPISSCFEIYGKEKVRLKKIGRVVHDEFDFIIALTAITNNFILVTDNIKHFQNFENLKLENWITR